MNYAAANPNQLVEFEPCNLKWSAAQLYNITVPRNNTRAALGNNTVVVPLLPWNLMSDDDSTDDKKGSRDGKYGPPPERGIRPSSCVALVTGLAGSLIGLGALAFIWLAVIFCLIAEDVKDAFPHQMATSTALSFLTMIFMFYIFQTKLNDAGTCYVVGYSPGIWKGLVYAGYVAGGFSLSTGSGASFGCSRGVLAFLLGLIVAAILAIYLMPFIALMQVGSGAVIGLAVATLVMLVDYLVCAKL
jgi:hypothetical protein